MSQRVDQSSQSNSLGRKIPQTKKQAAKPNGATSKSATSRTPVATNERPTFSAMASFAARLSEDERRRMIAEAAYYRSEKRGNDGGGEVDDWLAAEAEINDKFPQ